MNCSVGFQTTPELMLIDFSSFSGFAPNTCAARALTGKLPTWMSCPPMKLVVMWLK